MILLFPSPSSLINFAIQIIGVNQQDNICKALKVMIMKSTKISYDCTYTIEETQFKY